MNIFFPYLELEKTNLDSFTQQLKITKKNRQSFRALTSTFRDLLEKGLKLEQANDLNFLSLFLR